MTKQYPFFFGKAAHQIPLNFLGILFGTESKPPADPADVRINCHPHGNTVGCTQHDIGRLASDARQFHKLLHLAGHLAVVTIKQGLAAVFDVLRFIPKETGALDIAFQFRQLGSGEVGRRRLFS